MGILQGILGALLFFFLGFLVWWLVVFLLDLGEEAWNRSERSRAPRPNQPAKHDPATLLKWAAAHVEKDPHTLAEIARCQAGIGEWEGTAATLEKLERCGEKELSAAIHWTVDQMKSANEPPAALQYTDLSARQRPSPDDLIFAEEDPMAKYSRIPLAHFDQWADHDPQKGIFQAAWEGQFEKARTLARECKPPSHTNRASLLCHIARAQIASGDRDGAKQTLQEAFECALTLDDNEVVSGDEASKRQRSLSSIAVKFAEADDFASAEKIFEILRHDFAIDAAATGISIEYARCRDLANAARMLSKISLRDDVKAPGWRVAKATMDAVRVFHGERLGKTTWPYSAGYMVKVYQYATGRQ